MGLCLRLCLCLCLSLRNVYDCCLAICQRVVLNNCVKSTILLKAAVALMPSRAVSVHNPIVNRFSIYARHLRNLLPAAMCGMPSGAGFQRVSAAAVNDVDDAVQRKVGKSERERQAHHRWAMLQRVLGSRGQCWACSQQVHDSVPIRQWTVDSGLLAAGCRLPAVL